MNIYEAVEELKKETKPMFPHVQEAVDNASLTSHALIIREAGSGKTRIGTEILRNNTTDSTYTLWACPAALVEQAYTDMKGDGVEGIEFNSSITDFPKGKVVVASYDMIKSRIKQFTSVKWDVVICDEFHRTRNKGTIINEGIWYVRKKAKKFYALTATPFNNTESEFFELVSLVLGKNVVGKYSRSISIGKKKGLGFSLFAFMKKVFLGKDTDNPTKAKIVMNKRSIEKVLSNYIDYKEPEEYMNAISRPTPVSSIEKIELSNEEVKQYDRIYRSEGMQNKEMAYRMLLLNENSSKIEHATNEITSLISNQNNKVLVFSNFVAMGLGALSKSLKTSGIKHTVYSGSATKADKDSIIQNFKDGNIQVLLVSPSGFEGLNLKGTTHVIVLDPHYNPSKTTQLIARGLRAGSKTEKVIIKHYCAVSPRLTIPTVDEKIMKSSTGKREKNEALEGLLKEVKGKKK